MYDIASLGEVLVDFTECGVSAAHMRLFEQNPGGAPANILCAAQKYGLKTAFLGKVGDDMHGHFLKDTLAREGVDTRGLLLDAGVFTTLAFVALSPSGEREFSFARKPGADTCLAESELDRDILEHTRIFHTGSLSMTCEPIRSATLSAISIARASGALISYDPNYRASLWENEKTAIERMRALLPTADIVKLSDSETSLLTGESDPEKAAGVLFGMGVRLAVVTLGGDGASVFLPGASRYVPGFSAHAVDTTGAGDSFFGAFLSRFLQLHKSLDALTIEDAADMARHGNATASLCVERRGGIPAIPTLEEILGRLAQN